MVFLTFLGEGRLDQLCGLAPPLGDGPQCAGQLVEAGLRLQEVQQEPDTGLPDVQVLQAAHHLI